MFANPPVSFAKLLKIWLQIRCWPRVFVSMHTSYPPCPWVVFPSLQFTNPSAWVLHPCTQSNPPPGDIISNVLTQMESVIKIFQQSTLIAVWHGFQNGISAAASLMAVCWFSRKYFCRSFPAWN